MGDTLLSVDGEDIQGYTVEEIAPRIKGKVGSRVVLGPCFSDLSGDATATLASFLALVHAYSPLVLPRFLSRSLSVSSSLISCPSLCPNDLPNCSLAFLPPRLLLFRCCSPSYKHNVVHAGHEHHLHRGLARGEVRRRSQSSDCTPLLESFERPRAHRPHLAELTRRGYPDPFTVELTRIGMKSSSSSSQAAPSGDASRARRDAGSSASSSSSRLRVTADPKSASGLKGLPPGSLPHSSLLAL